MNLLFRLLPAGLSHLQKHGARYTETSREGLRGINKLILAMEIAVSATFFL